MTRCNASLMVDRVIEAGHGQKVAYASLGDDLSYEELHRSINRMGNLLHELGVRREERVLLVLDNTTTFPIVFLGALRVGAVPVPVSVLETDANLRHVIEDSYTRLVVCDQSCLHRVQEALENRNVRYLAPGGGPDTMDLDAALSAQSNELTATALARDDMAFWLYSSGSTGRPKGVVHLHKSIDVVCEMFAQRVLDIGESDRIFSTTKFYHAYGLGNSLLFPLYFGATCTLLDGAPAPERILQVLQELHPTVLFSVPALYSLLVGDSDADGKLASVRLCVSAAEPLPTRIFDRWRERFGLEIVDSIGSTEMLQAYCSNRPGAVVAGTMGRPVPGYDLRLLDEAGRELEGPAEGVLEVRGESRAAFYWHQSELTKRALRGEWFVTGDRVERREDGTYRYVARDDDMLKISGLWVSPLDMEQVLREHPAVADVAIVGVRIDDYSRIAAFVACSQGAKPDDSLRDSLRSWCKERMRDNEFPHLVRFVEELPKTKTGKIQRFELREMIAAEQGATPDRAQPTNQADDEAAGPQQGARLPQLADLAESERELALSNFVCSQVAAVLDQESASEVDPERSFKELGLDSVTAVELRNRLGRATAVQLPSTLVYDHPSPRAVARLLNPLLIAAQTGDEQADEKHGLGAQTLMPVVGTTEQTSDLAVAVRAIVAVSSPLPLPRAGVALRLKTAPWLRAALPDRLIVARAQRQGQSIWRQDPQARKRHIEAMESIVSGTSRAHECRDLAELHLIESIVDKALFWQRPWVAEIDPSSTARLDAALSGDRGILLSACHLGPYYRLGCAKPFMRQATYLVPGEWFFAPPSADYWGLRLARWRRGTKARLVPGRGSFPLLQALLQDGQAVFLFFDMPGQREARFLGKPAALADGTAQLAARADAIVIPVRARRDRHRVWIDAAEPIDPRDLGGAAAVQAALLAQHEQWILEHPAAMEDLAERWEGGASAEAWIAP